MDEVARLKTEMLAMSRQADMIVQVGAAQRQVQMILASAPDDTAGKIAAQRVFCSLIDQLIDLETPAAGPQLRRTIEMAVNEYGMLGDWLALAGDLTAAEAAFDRCIGVAEASDADLKIRARINVASHLLARGSFAQALALLLAARDLEATAGWPAAVQVDPVIAVEAKLSEAYRWLGDAARARAEREKALARLADRQAKADPIQRLLLEGKDFELRLEGMIVATEAGGAALAEAEAGLDALTPTFQALGIAPAAAFYRAKIELARGRASAALALLDAAAPGFQESEILRNKTGMLKTLRAQVLTSLGRGAEAVIDAKEAVAREVLADNRETVWKAHWRLAQAAIAAGDPRTALAAYDAAIEAVDGVRRVSLGYRLDNLFLRERKPMFDEAIDLAVRHGDARRCAWYVDAVKSRFLAPALAAGPPWPPAAAWVDRLDRLGEVIDRNAADDPVAVRAQADRAAMIERRRIDLSAAEALAPTPLDVEATLADLRTRGQAALSLYRLGDRIVATLLFDTAEVEAITLDAATQEAIRRYAGNLSQPSADQSTVDFDPARLRLSAEALVPPRLLARAVAADTLLIAPHAELNLIPWAMLKFRDGRLCQAVPVGVAPNLAAIAPLAARPIAAAKLALIGAPDETGTPEDEQLRHTLPEIEALAALYAAHGGLLAPSSVGAEATLARFRDLLDDPAAKDGVLHVSGHGVFARDDPAGSGLKLHRRRLTAAEIATRPLAFAEVTLSACSTALRPTAVGDVALLGDDVVGLPASFLEAGAGALLVSITEAEDAASAAFQCDYHQRRIAGAPPLAALAATQDAMLADARFRPHEWAGFCLYSTR
ncbi:CHAT domain-containing protein [Caulobacter sp. BK020]|uniref:CHAT domain-containing protein n=1 Tax=Caulobacter sp. BK020 TaxID=2512117 RepID=UPI00104595C2|nr:CHAT domain-containing protein [Caulobacter sp. BK020]TCS18454.1 CHAT domain-containing protein [Caulobacter sp. BK020]